MPITKLIITDGVLKGKEFAVGDVLTIGRSAENSIVINDDSVSRSHARIDKIGDKYKLYDLKSRNGVTVNGRKMAEADLRNGDTIKIGATILRFEIIDLKDATNVMDKPPGTPKKTVRSISKEHRLRKIIFWGWMVLIIIGGLGLFHSFLFKKSSAGADKKEMIEKKEETNNDKLDKVKKISEYASLGELLKSAEAKFAIGEQLYAERKISPYNLYYTVENIAEVLALTENLTPHPEIYSKAKNLFDIAAAELNENYHNLKFRVEQSLRLGEAGEALKSAEEIMEMFPDPRDERYKYGKYQYEEIKRTLNIRE